MALANVAEWYYRYGLRVVMVDWDLEAPGLENFFFEKNNALETVRAQVGIVDMLSAYKRMVPGLAASTLKVSGSDSDSRESSAVNTHVLPFREILQSSLPGIEAFLYPIRAPETKNGAALWLLAAGLRSGDHFESYAQQVQAFDWAEFYAEYEGQAYFDWLGDQLRRVGDVALIDSRTGVTEMGGVCARHLADVVVSFVAPNFQNLAGVKAMVASFRRQEAIDARGRDLQRVLVPSRLDVSEIDLRNEFEREFRNIFLEQTDVEQTDIFKSVGRTPGTLRSRTFRSMRTRKNLLSASRIDPRI